jgi:hypothetical protein
VRKKEERVRGRWIKNGNKNRKKRKREDGSEKKNKAEQGE